MILHVDLFEDRERICSDFIMVNHPDEISEKCEVSINRWLEREGRENAKNPSYQIIGCYYDDGETPL